MFNWTSSLNTHLQYKTVLWVVLILHRLHTMSDTKTQKWTPQICLYRHGNDMKRSYKCVCSHSSIAIVYGFLWKQLPCNRATELCWRIGGHCWWPLSNLIQIIGAYIMSCDITLYFITYIYKINKNVYSRNPLLMNNAIHRTVMWDMYNCIYNYVKLYSY